MSHKNCNHTYGHCAVQAGENINAAEWAAAEKWAANLKAAALAFDVEYLPGRQVNA